MASGVRQPAGKFALVSKVTKAMENNLGTLEAPNLGPVTKFFVSTIYSRGGTHIVALKFANLED